MAVTNYYSVNGQIVGEKTAGSSRVDYLTDALGSVTGTVDQSATLINTYRYKPFGTLLAKTGVGSDPAFQWVGSQGYRQTGKAFSDVYIRARHYSSGLGLWTTQDPMGMVGGPNKYVYVQAQPTGAADPSGLQYPTPCQSLIALADYWNSFPERMPPAIWRSSVPGQSNTYAVTFCDPREGEPRSRIYYDDNCITSCIIDHEAYHRAQFRLNCQKLQRLFKRGCPKIEDACDIYDTWATQGGETQGVFECPAYKRTLACFQGLYKTKCERSLPPPNPKDPRRLCCGTINLMILETQMTISMRCIKPKPYTPMPDLPCY